MRTGVNDAKPVPTEAEIQRACLEFLNLQYGCKCWRQNTGAFAGEYKGKRRFLRFGQPGQADITGIYNGLRIEIEIKRPGNKPTPDQEAWMSEMERLGGISFWCCSIEECVEKFKSYFATSTISIRKR